MSIQFGREFMLNENFAEGVRNVEQRLDEAIQSLSEDNIENLTLQQVKDIFDYLLKTQLSGGFIADCVSGKILFHMK